MARWKPKVGEKYWYIDKNGEIICREYIILWRLDEDRVFFGNCFKTEEEAEKALEKAKEFQVSLQEVMKNEKIKKEKSK